MRIGLLGPVDLDLLDWSLEPRDLPSTYRAPIVAHCANALRRRGHDVVVFTCSEAIAAPQIRHGDGFTVWIGRRRSRHRARDFFALERADLAAGIEALPCDVLHAHWTYEFALAALASGRPTLVTARDDATTILRHSRDAYRAARWMMDRRVLLTAPYLTANSTYLRQRFPEPVRRRTIVVPNSYDPATVHAVGLPVRPETVVSVANGFGRRKNLPATLHAFAALRQRRPQATLRLVGADMDRDGPAARYAAARRLTSGVEFVGRLAYPETLIEIESAAALLHSSLEESFGMTVLEAMVLGTPIVAGARSGNVPQLLGDGSYGALRDLDDPEAVATALDEALESGDGVRERVGAARRHAAANYASDVVAGTFEAAYQHVVRNWPGARRSSRSARPDNAPARAQVEPPRVWVVIAVHNRLEHTRRCLAALGRQTAAHLTTVVVDDGSTDGTASALAREFPEVVVLPGDGDLWWTGATNRGVAWALARADEGDFVLTLNNDAVLSDQGCDRLLAHAAEHPRALIGSLAVASVDPQAVVDGGLIIDWRSARHWPLNTGASAADALAEGPALRPTSVLGGRATLVPARVFREVGLYAASLPQYGADYELSRRAARHGWELYVAYDAPVASDTGATGLHDAHRSLGVADTLRGLWSMRSPNSLRYRWRYARLCVDGHDLPRYLFLDTLRVLGGRARSLRRAMGRSGAATPGYVAR